MVRYCLFSLLRAAPVAARLLVALGAAMVLAMLQGSPTAHADVVVVNSLLDDGTGHCPDTCQLREALTRAAPGDVITFSKAGVISLTDTLTLTQMVSIQGPGAAQLALDGRGTHRVISVRPGTQATISGLTIQNGNTTSLGPGTGAGIDVDGASLIVTSCVIKNNTALHGAGIAMRNSTLSVSNSTVADNIAKYEAGGAIAPGSGGGIYLTLGNSLTASGSSLTLKDSTISHNSAGSGAGIYANLSTLSISTSKILSNFGIETGNPQGASTGGGIYVSGSTVQLANSTLDGNTAGQGGGIYTVEAVIGLGQLSSTVVALTGSTLSGNVALDTGGTIYNPSIFADGIKLQLTSTTVSGNVAAVTGAGLYSATGATILSSTFSANTAPTGGSIAGSGNFTLSNSIVVGSPSGANCTARLTPLGTNNLSDSAACFPNDLANGNIVTGTPGVEPLADNGGPTKTHALLANSPAVDAGVTGGCRDVNHLTLATDQRGQPRGVDGNGDGTVRCDIGAFELGLALVKMSNGPMTFTEGDAPKPIDSGLTLTIDGATTLTSATVTITSGYVVGEDQLTFTTQNGITPSISSNGGALTLTLSGTAAVAQYQAALRSVTYASQAHPPSTAPRTIAFSIQQTPFGQISASRQVSVVNLPPVAVNDTYATVANTPLNVVASNGLLANDTDAAGAHLSVNVVAFPGHGTLVLDLNRTTGAFTYFPASGFVGTDTFTYRASDGRDQSQLATVTITVAATACVPRPRVQVAPTASTGKLQVHVEATPLNTPANNPLSRVDFGAFDNAKVTLNGQNIVSGRSYTVPAGVFAVDFTVERDRPGLPTTVPFTIVDGCGSWKSFVGGGTGAGF